MSFETFKWNEYQIRTEKRSVICPTKTHTETVGLRCPRCSRKNPTLGHARGVKCMGCGLHMCVYGNALMCATESEDELRGNLNLGPMAPPLVMLRQPSLRLLS